MIVFNKSCFLVKNKIKYKNRFSINGNDTGTYEQFKKYLSSALSFYFIFSDTIKTRAAGF